MKLSSDFVSILLDETSDVMNLSQLSTVLRYLTIDRKVHERFLGFSVVRADRTAEGFIRHVVNIV